MQMKKETYHPAGPEPIGVWANWAPYDMVYGGALFADCAAELDAPDGSPDEPMRYPFKFPPEMRKNPDRYFLLAEADDSYEFDFVVVWTGPDGRGFETEEGLVEQFDAWSATQWHVCPTCNGTCDSAWRYDPDAQTCPSCDSSRYVAWGEGSYEVTIENRSDDLADAYDAWYQRQQEER